MNGLLPITSGTIDGGRPEYLLALDLDGTLRPMDPISFMPYFNRLNLERLKDFRHFEEMFGPLFDRLSVSVSFDPGLNNDELTAVVLSIEEALSDAGPQVQRFAVPMILQYLIDDFDPSELSQEASKVEPFPGVDKLLENLLVDVGDQFHPAVITGSVYPYALGYDFVLELISMGGELHARRTLPNAIVQNLYPAQLATLGFYLPNWKNEVIDDIINRKDIGCRYNPGFKPDDPNSRVKDKIRDFNTNVIYVCDVKVGSEGNLKPTDRETQEYIRFILGGTVAMVMDPRNQERLGISLPTQYDLVMDPYNKAKIPIFRADYRRGTPLYSFIADQFPMPDHRRYYRGASLGQSALEQLVRIG